MIGHVQSGLSLLSRPLFSAQVGRRTSIRLSSSKGSTTASMPTLTPTVRPTSQAHSSCARDASWPPQFTTVLRSCLDRYSAVAKPVPAAGRAHDPRVAWLPEPKARAAMKIQEAGRHAAYGGHTPAIPISTEKEGQPTLLPQRQMSHICPATLNAPSQHAVNDRISTSIG